jgi:uncharacterized membrane protein
MVILLLVGNVSVTVLGNIEILQGMFFLQFTGLIILGAMRKRSLLKTMSWRVIATLGTVILVYIFTAELTISLGVGSADAILKTALYYLHERAWSRTDFGMQPKAS